MKKEVGYVTVEEAMVIKGLFERRNGLAELAKILPAENNNLYERFIKDMASTAESFQKWWDTTSAKYNWESSENGNWEIDFQSNKIYLVTKE